MASSPEKTGNLVEQAIDTGSRALGEAVDTTFKYLGEVAGVKSAETIENAVGELLDVFFGLF